MSDTVLSISQEQRKRKSKLLDPAISGAVFIAVMKHSQKELVGKGSFALLFHIVAHH